MDLAHTIQGTTNERGVKIEGKYRVFFPSTYFNSIFFFIFRKLPTLNYVNKE